MSKYKKAKRCANCAHRYMLWFIGEGKCCCDLKPQYIFDKYTRQPKWCPLKGQDLVDRQPVKVV